VREGQRVALVGICTSASLAALKLTVGTLSGSTALAADGFESTGDILASGLVWAGLTWAAKPADSNHPYGHGRAEMLSGLIVGMLLFCGGLAIAVDALANLGPVTRIPASYAIWPLIASILVKAWLLRIKWVTGKRIHSTALEADAMNDSVDMISGAVALAALTLTLYDPDHFSHADHYGASIVGLIMMLTGIRVARRTGSELMDTMPDEAFMADIRRVAASVPNVSGVEKVFARKTGLQHHVDIHLEVDPEMPVRASHELGHIVEEVLKKNVEGIAHVLVHIEPARTLYDRNRHHFQKTLTNLSDAVLTISEARTTHEPFGEVRMYFEGATDLLKELNVGSLLLEPGMRPHPPHMHPEEELWLVAEGAGVIQLGDEVKQVGPGVMMYCAGNKLHGIENTGSSPMLFYFYKWLA
jgi:cation diffusion facilitator family transporter